jgi:hypothetical protein
MRAPSASRHGSVLRKMLITRREKGEEMDDLHLGLMILGILIGGALYMIALAVNNLFHAVQEGLERLEKITKRLNDSLEWVADRLDPPTLPPPLYDPYYDPKAARDRAHES